MTKTGVFVFCFLLLGMPLVFPDRAEAAEGKALADPRAQAQMLLDQDIQSFLVFSRQGFDSRVDDDFIPDRVVFLNVAEDAFLRAHPQELTFTLNEVIPAGDKLSVSFRWRKKVVDDAGQAVLKEGDAGIVYIDRDGDWLIYQVEGSSPFTL